MQYNLPHKRHYVTTVIRYHDTTYHDHRLRLHTSGRWRWLARLNAKMNARYAVRCLRCNPKNVVTSVTHTDDVR